MIRDRMEVGRPNAVPILRQVQGPMTFPSMEKELTEVEHPALQQVYDEHLQIFKARTVHLMDVAQISLANHVINKRAESSTVVKTKRKRTSEHGSPGVNDRWDGRT